MRDATGGIVATPRDITVYQQVIKGLQEQVDSQREDIEHLKRTTTDLQIDLRSGLSSVKSMCESQYLHIDGKFTILSSMLDKLENGQLGLTRLVEQQIGAEAERARLRKENLDRTHQKAEEAAIEAEKAKLELHGFQRRITLRRWYMFIIATIISVVGGIAIKSSSVDYAIMHRAEHWIHAFNHRQYEKTVDNHYPTVANAEEGTPREPGRKKDGQQHVVQAVIMPNDNRKYQKEEGTNGRFTGK